MGMWMETVANLEVSLLRAIGGGERGHGGGESTYYSKRVNATNLFLHLGKSYIM